MTTEPTEPNPSFTDPWDRSHRSPPLDGGIGVRSGEASANERLNPTVTRPNDCGFPQTTTEPGRRTAEERAVRMSRGSLRPITAEEAPFTVALGDELRRLRLVAGVGKREMARLSGLSERWYYQLEYGATRARRSSIEKLAGWLIPFMEWATDDGPSDEQERQVVDHLVAIAGPALAPERSYRR